MLGVEGDPAEPSRNHEVEHQEDLAFRFHRDPLAEAVEIDDASPDNGGERRLDRTEQERRREAYTLDAAAEDPRRQGVQVEENVWQFRHGDW